MGILRLTINKCVLYYNLIKALTLVTTIYRVNRGGGVLENETQYTYNDIPSHINFMTELNTTHKKCMVAK